MPLLVPAKDAECWSRMPLVRKYYTVHLNQGRVRSRRDPADGGMSRNFLLSFWWE